MGELVAVGSRPAYLVNVIPLFLLISYEYNR